VSLTWTGSAYGQGYEHANTSSHTPNVAVPAHATRSGDGIVVGSSPVQIDTFIDFLCPFCRQFEERSGSLLKRFVDDRVATTRSSVGPTSRGCAS